MLFLSGIGRYLREILCRMPASLSGFSAYCNGEEQVSWVKTRFPGAIIVLGSDSIYGLGEQCFRPWRLRHCAILWTPHYNFVLSSDLRQIVTVHDLAHIALPDIFGRGLKRIYSFVLMKAIGACADRIVFISQFTRGEFRHYIDRHNGVGSVIYNGVEWAVLRADNDSRESFYLYVGNIKPHKNLKRLGVALASLPSSGSRHLVIAGKQEGFITGVSEPLDFGDAKITFTGEIDDTRLWHLYTTARALVFPSTYEGFGLPPLEAMACGCPVLASDAAAISEVCGADFSSDGEENGNLLYFSPTDVESIVETILKFEALQPPAIARMIANAKRHSLNYSWDQTAKATWDLIEREVKRVNSIATV
jgi:glycosyltransferase involved in cell wall biosynthesis